MMDDPGIYFESDRLQSVVLKNSQGEILHSVPAENQEPIGEWDFIGHMGFSPSDIQSGNPSSAQKVEWGLDEAQAVYAEIQYLDDADELVTFNCRFGKIVEEEIVGSDNTVHKNYWIYVQFDKMVYLTWTSNATVANVLKNLQAE